MGEREHMVSNGSLVQKSSQREHLVSSDGSLNRKSSRVSSEALNRKSSRFSSWEAIEDIPELHEANHTSGSELESWCKSMGLSDVVFRRLRHESFSNPEHLVYLNKSDLIWIVDGLKLGEKCSFLHAVRLLRLEQGFAAWDFAFD